MKGKLKASTMTEMLVLMVISGVILLGVFEGFELFMRMARRSSAAMEYEIAQAMSYNRLEYMFRTADSAKGDGYRVELFRRGAVSHTLSYSEPFLTVDNGDGSGDTLFSDVTATSVRYGNDKHALIDTLLVSRGDGAYIFAVDYKHDFLTIEGAERLEEKERYEN